MVAMHILFKLNAKQINKQLLKSVLIRVDFIDKSNRIKSVLEIDAIFDVRAIESITPTADKRQIKKVVLSRGRFYINE